MFSSAIDAGGLAQLVERLNGIQEVGSSNLLPSTSSNRPTANPDRKAAGFFLHPIMLARDALFTVIDFETTGSVQGYPDEPWQIGMVAMENGQVQRHLEAYLHIASARPFNPYAPGRHASLRTLLATAPSPADCFPTWRPWLENRILVAHNIGTERKILSAIAPLHQFGPWLDTLTLAHRLLPRLRDYSLSAVISALNLSAAATAACPSRDYHDALFDATATALFLQYLLALPSWQSVSIHALLAASRSHP